MMSIPTGRWRAKTYPKPALKAQETPEGVTPKGLVGHPLRPKHPPPPARAAASGGGPTGTSSVAAAKAGGGPAAQISKS